MKNSTAKTTKSRVIHIPNLKETTKIISEEDIRRRAYEIYLSNDDSSSSELDNWFYAERELMGLNKLI
jgi:hypothetical protein